MEETLAKNRNMLHLAGILHSVAGIHVKHVFNTQIPTAIYCTTGLRVKSKSSLRSMGQHLQVLM